MLYRDLVDVYEKLTSTTKKLEKKDILSKLYKKCPEKYLYKVVLLSMGSVFPKTGEDLGIANEMVKRVIAKACGVSKKDIEKKFKETGDLGMTAEYFVKNKKQFSLVRKNLTVDKVYDNLRKLPEVVGAGSQDRKISLIAELISSATPTEAKYIVRTVTGDMRIGVAEGIVRDAIADAFHKKPDEIERAYNVSGDYGKVAEMAKKGRLKERIELFTPVRVMLAERAKNLEEAMKKFERPAIEIKYDGFRVAIHKDGTKIKIFSRRLDDVTRQFPEIVNYAKKQITAKRCIVEGEVIAIDKKGRPLPFQRLSRRIQRKYNIEKMVKEIPVEVNLFDLIYLDGDYMNKKLSERWGALKKIIRETKFFHLAGHIETKDMKKAEEFYKKSLAMGEEGVIVKNLDAHYQPGKRVGYWLKVKPIMEPLDLVVIGATWGEGKRAKWLSSFLLAARDGDKFVDTGMMASGLTEEQLEEMTKKLKKLIISEEGKQVKLKPKVVIEVGYEEIQKSPKYKSGYALRFPRLLRIRDPKDKGPEEANTVKDIEKLYKQQRGREVKQRS